MRVSGRREWNQEERGLGGGGEAGDSRVSVLTQGSGQGRERTGREKGGAGDSRAQTGLQR